MQGISNQYSEFINILLIHNDSQSSTVGFSAEGMYADGIISNVGIIGGGSDEAKSEYDLESVAKIPHMVGHMLGLYHTYHGCVKNAYVWEPPYYNYNNPDDINVDMYFDYDCDPSGVVVLKEHIDQCAELVSGVNSATCGDYIEDTPADYYLHHAQTEYSDCSTDPTNSL
jgi:hypothetical protein